MTPEDKEWLEELSPSSLQKQIDEYSESLQEHYEGSRDGSFMQFSFDELDNYIQRTHYDSHAIAVYVAKLRKLKTELERKNAAYQAKLYKDFTDICLKPTSPGSNKDGTPKPEKSPVGLQKIDAEYRKTAYTSDKTWHEQRKELERVTELLEVGESIQKSHNSKLFMMPRMLEERIREMNR